MNIELCDKRRAILDCQRHLLVTGGPGSGKTTIALLKAQKLAPMLLPGQQVLFLSFSRAAVRQILERCRSILTPTERQLIKVQTYHSFCLDLLRPHGALVLEKQPQILFPGRERLRKSQFPDDWTTEQQRLALEEGVVCFDMFAGVIADLLERVDLLRALLADSYPLIIVDEFQDTDNDQWRLVSALALGSTIFCLADPDQRIFDFRPTVDSARIDQVRAMLQPEEFDLRGENHRSPASGILNYANVVLHDSGPLPQTNDVTVLRYEGRDFDAVVHHAVLAIAQDLEAKDINKPNIAVLARTNKLILQLSEILYRAHTYRGRILVPVQHDVIWDSQLSAGAAAVIGSILEWSQESALLELARTLQLIAQYYELKNAERRSNESIKQARQYRDAALAVLNNAPLRIKAAKSLQACFAAGFAFTGDPVVDWRSARQILDNVGVLSELSQAARMVRLFRMTDVLASGLADLWLSQGAYLGAVALIQRTLERESLDGAEQHSEGCVLMNMHKSKGKEFDGVVIVEGMSSALFFDVRRSQPPYESCRRLLRVGITRARHLVTIVRHAQALPLVSR